MENLLASRKALAFRASTPVGPQPMRAKGAPQFYILVTKALIENVTKSLNEVNFMGFEARINKLILTLLENPVK